MADPTTCPPLTPSSIIDAHEKIKPYIHRTPLITSKTLNRIASHPDPRSFLSSNPTTTTTTDSTNGSAAPVPKFNLYFKCENRQKIGAFKARGAFHALIHLVSAVGLDTLRRRGVTTHSSGNHAQALAYAAHTFGVPAHIVMPTISTPSKIAGTRAYTEHVVFSGSTSDEREAKVAEVIAATGAILVPPYDHPDIILGQGTAALEMEQQLQDLRRAERRHEKLSPTAPNGVSAADDDETPSRFDAVITPLGGGGLLGGTATWFSSQPDGGTRRHHHARTLVFGAEPSFSGANDAQRGLAASPPARVPHVSSLTIADGLRTPVGVLNWTVVSDRARVEGVYSAGEAEIAMALRLVLERVKEVVEPSAVVGLAVVLFCDEFRGMVAQAQRGQGRGRAWDVGVVLSGGNTTVEAVVELFGKGDGKEEEKRQAGLVGMDGGRTVEDVAG